MYSPGFRSTSTFDVPPPATMSPTSSTPSPSIAMLWSVAWSFSDSTSSWPAGASASANLYARPLADGDRELAALGLRRALRLRAAGVREPPGVLAGLRGRGRDVGGDVLRVLAGHEVLRHQRERLAGHGIDLHVLVGLRDLAMDHALERRAAESVLRRLLERLIEVGPDDALRVRARERVALRALLDEQGLAVHEVVVAALELAAAQGDDREAAEQQRPGASSVHRAASYLLAGRREPAPHAAATRPGDEFGAAARRAHHEARRDRGRGPLRRDAATAVRGRCYSPRR